MRSSSRHSGFTLLEVIVALVVTSLVGAALYSSVRTASRARDAASETLAPVRAVEAALDLIKSDIENALPATGTLAGPFVGQLFGTNARFSDDMEFYAMRHCMDDTSTDPTRQGGICKINLYVDRDSTGQSVLLRTVTSNLLSLKKIDPEAETLCRGVRTLTFRYFDGQTWRETWDSTTFSNMLPVAVAVTIEVDGRNGPDGKPTVYRVVRIISLPCYVDTSTTTTTTTGGGG